MNILIITGYGLYQNLSYSFVYNQAKVFADLGHSVRVLVLTPWGKERKEKRIEAPIVAETINGVESVYIRYLSLSNFGNKHFNFNLKTQINAINNYLRSNKNTFVPDVIIGNQISSSKTVTILKKRFNCPSVLISHGSDTEVPFRAGNLEYIKDCCDKADAVCAVSSKLQKELQKSGTKTKLFTILDGFASENIPVDISNKKEHSWIQVGNLIPQKHNDVTIKAFAGYKQSHFDATLKIVGQGVMREQLKGLCEELNIKDSVAFCGQLPNDETLKLMSESKYFVMPSSPEGFGIVYLEAMACGCITIGTKGEGITDVIEPGKNGFLVPANNPDEIVKCIDYCENNPTEKEKIAAAGKETAMNLTWERNAQEYTSLCNSLIKKYRIS